MFQQCEEDKGNYQAIFPADLNDGLEVSLWISLESLENAIFQEFLLKNIYSDGGASQEGTCTKYFIFENKMSEKVVQNQDRH